MSLFDKRVVVVTGKGGTGKTTVAASLGLLAARMGKRTLICETNGTSQICPLFRRTSQGYTPVPIHPRLSAMSITSNEAIEDYVVQQVKVRALYTLVFRNRIMGPFMDAVPGLHDAVQLGKVFDLTEEKDAAGDPVWDLIIVDAPATGHGLNMLAAPQSMMELTRAGPIHEANKLVDEVISDPERTAIVLTCLPEAMPVNETLTLWDRLEQRKNMVSTIVLNEMLAPLLENPSDWDEARPVLMDLDQPEMAETVHLTDRWLSRVDQQNQARAQLQEGIDVPIIDLPFLLDRNLSFSDITTLSECLEAIEETP